MIGKPIVNVRLIRLAKTDEVDCDNTTVILKERNDVPPDVDACRVAVQQENGISTSALHVVHPGAAYFDVFGTIGEIAA